MRYQHVFTPIQLGPKEIRNRLYCSAHHTGFAAGGLVNERHNAYYEARARGGVGMIITGIQNIVAPDPDNPPCTSDDEALAPGQGDCYRRLTERVHRHGTTILAQLGGFGRQDWNTMGHMEAMPAPSAIPAHGGFVPKELEREEMTRIVADFAQAAAVVRDGGFDGVELHCAYGYLLASFLSPTSNHRTDEYGGSLENRMRFPVEALAAVKAELGDDLILGVRLLADEYVEGGIGLAESCEMARGFEETGMVDYINATIATYNRKAMITYPMFFPMGLTLDLAQNIKNAIDIPVLTAGRLKDPAMIESALADHKVDMVGMARALITDPDLPNKMLEGREDEICSCIGCNQKCNGNLVVGLPITCMQNPLAGREYLPFWSTLNRAEPPKRIVVIGGGPAGCEAALTLAQRGHNVSLYDRGSELGGQLLTVAKAPGREEWQDVYRFHSRELARLGVDVNLGVEMDAEGVLALDADDVVIATGSSPRTEPYPQFGPVAGVDRALNVREVLDGAERAGSTVVVYAGDDHMQGISTAEILLDQGRTVHVVCTAEVPGMLADMFTVEYQLERLTQKGLAGLRLHSRIKSFDGERVTGVEGLLSHPFEIRCDTLVSSFGGDAAAGLYRDLKGRCRVHRIGDALAPRTADFAIFDGATLGREL